MSHSVLNGSDFPFIMVSGSSSPLSLSYFLTIFAARQFVNHGHVMVNGKRTNIQSYRCRPGDVIEVREKSKQLALVLEATQLAERDVPDYIDVDHNKMVATYTHIPGLADVPYAVQMEPNLVVEFYSR